MSDFCENAEGMDGSEISYTANVRCPVCNMTALRSGMAYRGHIPFCPHSFLGNFCLEIFSDRSEAEI
jgi:hypothetical protein